MKRDKYGKQKKIKLLAIYFQLFCKTLNMFVFAVNQRFMATFPQGWKAEG